MKNLRFVAYLPLYFENCHDCNSNCKSLGEDELTRRNVGVDSDEPKRSCSNNSATNLKVSAEKMATEKISLGTDVSVNLETDLTKCYEYEVMEDGVYSIVTDSYTPYMYVYSSMQGNNAVFQNGVTPEGARILLKAGEKIYIRTADSSYLSTYVFTLGKENVLELTETTAVTVENGETEGWISFTAPETNVYNFTSVMDSTATASNYARLYAVEDGTYYGYQTGGDVTYEYPLDYDFAIQEGETVYLRVDNENDTPMSISVKKVLEDVKELKLENSLVDVSLEEGDEGQWILFISPEDARYTFYSSGSKSTEAVYYRNSLDEVYDTNSSSEGDVRDTIYITEGYYLCLHIKDYYSEKTEFQVCVEVYE